MATELYNSRSEQITAQGITATRIFIADWATRHVEAPRIGDPYPDLVGAYCIDVQIEPYTWADDGSGHDPASGPNKAKIVARYGSSDFSRQQQPDDWMEESLDFGGEMLSRGGGKWESDQKPVEENDPGAVAYYPRAEYVRTIIIDDITGWAKKIYEATGKLNSSSFLGGKKETWLFQGATAVKFMDQDGTFHWRMTFKFVYRKDGWNKTWRKDDPTVGGKWDSIKFTGEDGKEKYLYETTSFTRLLTRTP
jgi:hypothetical protein